jgi:hypothetical protein
MGMWSGFGSLSVFEVCAVGGDDEGRFERRAGVSYTSVKVRSDG